jgi:RNA polymerase sigma factor for flagellar operon FliA
MPIDSKTFDAKVSPDEERELWARFAEEPASDSVRVRLVELYLPLVSKAANSMPDSVKRKTSFQELVSAGVLGLHEAISSFKSDAGASFATFASKWIRGAMLDDLRKVDRLTRTQRNSYKELCAAIASLTQRLSRPPTDDEISSETGLGEAEIDRIMGMGAELVNLSDEFKDGLRYMDVIPDTSSPSTEESVNDALALERVKAHFLELDDREQKILFLRHFQDLSVKEIAAAMELSEGRISQIYHKSVVKLRAMLKVQG